jgi:hypothetical protein
MWEGGRGSATAAAIGGDGTCIPPCKRGASYPSLKRPVKFRGKEYEIRYDATLRFAGGAGTFLGGAEELQLVERAV